MADQQSDPVALQPLADLDQVIHAPARLMVLTYLYVVESVDYVFLKNVTGLTWGNLATHLGKLEEAGYVASEKGFQGRKPHAPFHSSAGMATRAIHTSYTAATSNTAATNR